MSSWSKMWQCIRIGPSARSLNRVRTVSEPNREPRAARTYLRGDAALLGPGPTRRPSRPGPTRHPHRLAMTAAALLLGGCGCSSVANARTIGPWQGWKASTTPGQ